MSMPMDQIEPEEQDEMDDVEAAPKPTVDVQDDGSEPEADQ